MKAGPPTLDKRDCFLVSALLCSVTLRFFNRRKMPKLDKTITERKHLVSAEVDKLLNATKGRNEARNRYDFLSD
jgi:hypothetical protein